MTKIWLGKVSVREHIYKKALRNKESLGITHGKEYMFIPYDKLKKAKSYTDQKFKSKYNGKEYTFLSLEIKSSGQRDADGDTFKVSGTNQRRYAFRGDFENFRKGTPTALTDNSTKQLMQEIKNNLPKNFK